jgi:hypothetical protein
MSMDLRTWTATWPRRLGLAAAVFVMVFVIGVLWLRYLGSGAAPGAPSYSDATIMNVLFTLPGLMSAAVFALASVFGGPAQAASNSPSAAAAPPAAAPEAPFKAQVVGIQWLNPLVWRDYPTEWQLLWVLGLAQPNKNDDMVKEDPKKFSSVQPVASIVSNARKKAPFHLIFDAYVQQLVAPLRDRYFMNGGYVYTVQPDDPKKWRELGGIRMEFAIPTTPDLLTEQAAQIVRQQMTDTFSLSSAPKLATQNIPADVHLTPGAANAGFTSLNAAMDYLQANPGKTAWVLNWDSPQYPNDESLSENCTLLVLAGPKMETKREPLAWIARPAFTKAQDFEPKEAASKVSQAWSTALKQAATNAQIKLGEVAYMVHDVGVGDISAKRVSGLAQALTEHHPEFQYFEQGFNTAKLLGEMRAGTAVTNLALAVAWTHQKGKPVLVAGSTEPDNPVAVIVLPPSRARIADPNRNWFRARGEGNAYLPWWGLRRDADWSKVGQGFSD